jgi:thiamine-monophosphate kinase
MRELQILKRIRKMASGSSHPLLIRGIGDDCAILRPRPNEELVFTTDFVLEGRHFTLEGTRASEIGHRALTRSLSDLAAMGSEPVFCLVSLAVPAELSGAWINGFYRGLLALAREHKMALAGGDLARFDKIVADVMCCGRVPRGKAMLRSAAKSGDAIYVTGKLGRSGKPQPRVAEGLALRRSGVSAAIDISDGLVIDLHRLCIESGVSAELDEIPLAKGATLDDALYRGEDYELLFTARLGKFQATRIGTITAGKPGQVSMKGKVLPTKGFDHFDESPR